jgi:hypothetical protein
MRQNVIVFSSDFVRGNILIRRIAREDVLATLHDNLAAVRTAMREHPPRVVVFDSTGSMAGEVRSLPAFAESLTQDTLLLVLGGNADELAAFSCACRTEALPGVIDPEAVAALIRDECLKAPGRKQHTLESGEAKAPMTQPLNLEEDLVAFLKLE